MENVKNYDSFLNEYYKGKNKKIGFNYLPSEETFDVEFYVGTIDEKLSEEQIEEVFNDYFKSVFDEYTSMIDITQQEEKNEININVKNNLGIDLEYLYNFSVKFDAYNEIEVYSMLDALIKKMGKKYNIIIMPNKLNGKPITKLDFLPNKKNKIGF